MTNVKRSVTISKNLKWMRLIRGYTQRWIAETLDIPSGTYGAYETGSTGIGKERLQKLCDFWNVDVEHLEMNPEDFRDWYRKEHIYGSQASR